MSLLNELIRAYNYHLNDITERRTSFREFRFSKRNKLGYIVNLSVPHAFKVGYHQYIEVMIDGALNLRILGALSPRSGRDGFNEIMEMVLDGCETADSDCRVVISYHDDSVEELLFRNTEEGLPGDTTDSLAGTLTIPYFLRTHMWKGVRRDGTQRGMDGTSLA